MEIQKRDLEILKFCLEQKFATLLQITKMYFPESRDIFHRPAKRVCELVKAGLLKAEQLRVCEKKLYMTTREGVKLLKSNNLGSELHAVNGLDARTLEHDEMVTDVRIIFDRLLGLRKWMPERILKQKAIKQKVPDGIVAYDNQKLVIEVERTLKNKRYYEKVFYSPYTRDYDRDSILYIMNNKTDMQWLMKEAKNFEQIYFATIDDLNCMLNGGVTFKNESHGYFELPLASSGSVHFVDAMEEYDHWDGDTDENKDGEESKNQIYDS